MAQKKKSSANESLNTLKTHLEGMVKDGLLSQELADKQLKLAEAGMKAPARDKIGDAMEKAVQGALKGSKEIEEAFSIIGDGGFTVSVVIKEGKMSAVHVRKASVRSSSGATGKRPRILIDGKEFPHFAGACRHYGLEVGTNSAHRVYDAAHTRDPESYPAYEEV